MYNAEMVECKQKCRRYEFDLAKFIAIVPMVWVHVYEQLSTGFSPSVSHTVSYVVGSILGATTFMLCMGIGMVYTRHNTAEEYIHRGFNLFTTGLVLIFFQEIIPNIISCVIYSDTSVLQYLIYGVSVDILEFAGLAYILAGLLKKWRIGSSGVLLISIFLSIAGTLLEGVQTGNYGIDQILGFFWGTYSQSYFPLFNWFIFVAVGLWFGEKCRKLQDMKRFHLISLPIGIIVCAAYIYISFNVEQSVFKGLTSEIYLAHRPFVDAIVCLPINVALISLCHFIGKLIPQKAMPLFTYLARHINQYYCISWVIICILDYDFCIVHFNTDSEVVCWWLIVQALTIVSVIVYDRYLQDYVVKFFGRRRAFWTIFIWAVCIGVFVWGLCTYDVHPNLVNGYSVE